MKYPERSQCKYATSPYRIHNWPGYEAGLRIYAYIAIEAALTIRMVFHLPLRQTEGFLRSLADMLEAEIPVPDHTTLSRRLRTLGKIPVRMVANDRPTHLLIDSTGLRIHVGNLRKPPKNRAWGKLHLAFDASGTSGQASASAAWSRTRSTGTRQSSVDV